MAAKDKSPLILEYIIIMGTMMGSREQGLSTIVSALCVSATNRPGTSNPIKSLGMNYKLPISSLSQVGPARCGSTGMVGIYRSNYGQSCVPIFVFVLFCILSFISKLVPVCW